MASPPPTLLIVEDNEVARVGLGTVLEKAGYRVDSADNGQTALDYLGQHPAPQLILLDMLLPVLDGWLFLEQLGRLNLQPKPPIIITTGSNIIGQEWAAAHGCAGLVRKPIDTEELLAQIRRCLGETP